MIHAIDLLFCAISMFIFKNVFTFILSMGAGYLILNYLAKKLSNVSIILYVCFFITLIVGGFVLVLLPDKENKLSNVVIDSYYLGTIAFLILVALLISIAIDLFKDINKMNKKTHKKEIKEKKEPVRKEEIKEVKEIKEETKVKKDNKPKKEVKKKVVQKKEMKPVKTTKKTVKKTK